MKCKYLRYGKFALVATLLSLVACTSAEKPCYAPLVTDFPAFPPENVDKFMDMHQMWAQLGVTLPDLPLHAEDPMRPEHVRCTHESGKYWTDEEAYSPNSPAGYMVKRSLWGEWTNFTEDINRVGNYSTLDPLVFDNGRRVKNLRDWERRRAPQIWEHCQEDIWGYVPEVAKSLTVRWTHTEGPVETMTLLTQEGKEEEYSYVCHWLLGEVDTSYYSAIRHQPLIKAVLYLPVDASPASAKAVHRHKRGCPVIIQFGQSVDRKPSKVAIAECFQRGWGYLLYDSQALQPDNGGFVTDYLIGLCNKGNWRKPEDWGAIGAWSWGVSRLIDWMEDKSFVNAEAVGVTGHSRFGKTALLAMVYEPRLATAYVSCSGVLGAAPMRTNWGENLEVIATEGSYFWAAGNIFKWVGPLGGDRSGLRKRELLRTDAHLLLSLAAPRPVFINAGTTDSWANPFGMYCTCRDASPVYQLYGYPGLVMSDRIPVADKTYDAGRIAYRLHTGGHTDLPDWPAFATFADRFLP